jgi:hypothetical protein
MVLKQQAVIMGQTEQSDRHDGLTMKSLPEQKILRKIWIEETMY